ncbi:uncharacterized protein [Solanum lycopersicum]|uniref:uncharacterized protein n=1 Tax=Solanum lycopersicum TaxID=4081 RepID=UPI0037481618
MENGCCKFVQKCYICQVHSDLIRLPPHELNAKSSPWPFVAWGMDVISPIEPPASNGFWLPLIISPSGWKQLLTSYRPTVRTSTGATPYLLVYGTEAVIPAKVEIPSLRIIQEAELRNVEWKRVRAKKFEVGQLVFKRIFPHQHENKGKSAPNWKGPYMVRKVLSGGALVLS